METATQIQKSQSSSNKGMYAWFWDTKKKENKRERVVKEQEGILSDEFDRFDSTKWQKADAWTNGNPFNNGWRAQNVEFKNGKMVITIDGVSSSGKPYTSGEYRTQDFYGFGSLEASIKPGKSSGTVSGSLFFYTGPSDGNSWDEIDVEFLGKDTGKMQTNYYTNGVGGHEHIVQLGFDASKAFHKYKIKWEENKITWYVDDKQVHSENGSRGPLPKTPGKIMMNAWPGIGVDGWLGKFNYSSPISAEYDWIKYVPAKDGSPSDHQKKVESRTEKKVNNANPKGNISSFEMLGKASFNGAEGGLDGNNIELTNPSLDNNAGYTMFFSKSVKGKLTFNVEKGKFIILFIKGVDPSQYEQDENLSVKMIKDKGSVTLNVPAGTNKINIMPRDNKVIIKDISIK